MTDRAQALLDWLLTVPDWIVYLAVGLATTLENVVPPIPSDVFVLVGGVIAGGGGVRLGPLFLAAWAGNVGGGLFVYFVGRRYGPSFFDTRWGASLLVPRQLESLARAYRRFGFVIIFLGRFLPLFRPVVPVFAGVTRLGFFATALPMALASAIWYGALFTLGRFAGANLGAAVVLVERLGGWLWLAAGALALLAAGWWWWSRKGNP
jgi:membrane protein DedA with SNARE-associated domain